MLALDSLITDLMFNAGAELEQQTLIDGLGGETALGVKKLLDADMLDPRQEMELSPSMPFRRRGERRLMLIDDAVAPMRKDPQADFIVPIDLRPYKEALIETCTKLPVRLGRLFALGSWGDAVLVARDARDLRAICLLPWALDPQVDIDGKRRQGRLSQPEFEAKIMAFDKRIEEMSEQDIIDRLSGVNFERRGDLLIVDVLEADGTWDVRKSIEMENQLAAVDRFSMLPGAPSRKPGAEVATTPTKPTPAPAPVVVEKKPEPKGPPLTVASINNHSVLVFPEGRFDLDVAAALGKRDWESVLRSSDNIPGQARDQMHRDGAAWIAPLEFLSEVFIDGKPVSKPVFEQGAQVISTDGAAVRALEVHFPRFGTVTLFDVGGKSRFVTTFTDAADVAKAATLVTR